jgi:hypothetical protein
MSKPITPMTKHATFKTIGHIIVIHILGAIMYQHPIVRHEGWMTSG